MIKSLPSSKDVEVFDKAVEAYIRKHGRSAKAARSQLIKIGIVTDTGRMKKAYRS
jgi:hypothetical protein